ncbi:MAG: 1-deoxy-D-xylulose-5-phosphate reductoisomerase [Muribaculaceae bacterium]
MDNKKQIAILGSTGSIGRQTLDILSEYPDLFAPYLLTANTSVDLLIEQALKYSPKHAIISDSRFYQKLKDALAGTGITVGCGSEAIADAVTADEIDVVVTAMVGYSGLEPTIRAIKAGKDIALANKETLVVAGELITELLKSSPSRLFPVDSEHGAIYQCIVGESHSAVNKLILTASGGPFRTWDKEDLAKVTKTDALRHPNWSMGAKITIDSASMMNKGFEVMEAKWLFGVDADRIEVVVHPQSIVHSMVEFVDGSVKAQLGLPDMHLPIRYALGLPDRRLKSDCRKLRVEDYANLTFEHPDFEKFPMLGIAYEAIRRGGNIPCVLNAANEIAVAAFLNDQIGFRDIPRIAENAIEHAEYIPKPTYDDYVTTNRLTREYAQNNL